jgi:hypothetical protein
MTYHGSVSHGALCQPVPEVTQRHTWDCGLACAAMVAAFLHPRRFPADNAYELIEGRWVALCGGRSVTSLWTIDLLHLLHDIADSADAPGSPGGAAASPPPPEHKVQFTFSSTTLSVNDDLRDMTYYAQQFAADAPRVVDRFRVAAARGWALQERHVAIKDVLAALAAGAALYLMLVDAASLTCECADPVMAAVVSALSCCQRAASIGGACCICLNSRRGSRAASGSDSDGDGERGRIAPDGTPPATAVSPLVPFCGHFIVLCGFDRVKRQVLYRNPGSRCAGGYCVAPVAVIEAARRRKGTDEDFIRIDNLL